MTAKTPAELLAAWKAYEAEGANIPFDFTQLFFGHRAPTIEEWSGHFISVYGTAGKALEEVKKGLRDPAAHQSGVSRDVATLLAQAIAAEAR